MGLELELRARKTAREALAGEGPDSEQEYDRAELISEYEKQMLEAANALEFEKAAHLRDRIKEVKASPEMGPIKKRSSKPRKPKPGTPGTKVIKKKKKR